MPTTPLKRTPVTFGRTPAEMRRLNQRIVLGITIVVVGSILVADGFLVCRYLQKREMAMNGDCPIGCVSALMKNKSAVPVVPTSADPAAVDLPASLAGGATDLSASYEHGAVGFSFKYPAAWGEVSISEESGRLADGSASVAGLILTFDELSRSDTPAVFAHASNPGLELASRSASYWGIEGAQIKSTEVVQNWCDGRAGCSIFQNSQGLLVARTEAEIKLADDTAKRVYHYYIFNPHSGYGGLVLSNQSLVELEVAESAGLFEQVVDSLSWLGE